MTTAAAPMTPAERSKLARSRKAMGVVVYHVEMKDDTLRRLIDAGVLTEAEAASRPHVETELASLIEWAASVRDANSHA